ncbi:MAG: zinc-binding dehydrogenase, partial [Christiangramia sp.]|nr:zinc-binding dehydrogenase [Christiangramia sp.]
GEKAMVNGGTGAIGSSLIQLLKYYGLEVVATGPAEHVETLLSLGAKRVIDYKTQDFTRDEEKFDYVFDSVGKSTFGECKRLLVKDGIYISSELGPYSQNPFLAISTTFSEGKKVRFPLPVNIPESLKIISELIESGNYRPLIDRTYPMEQVKEAFEYVMTGRKIGNVILSINHF